MRSHVESKLPVVLVGPPGAGKSAVAVELAIGLGVTWCDTDAVIESETGRTIADIFARDGESEFRRIASSPPRPLFAVGDAAVAYVDLIHERAALYLEVSGIQVCTEGGGTGRVASDILSALGEGLVS